MVSEQFSLKWNNHTNHLVGVFGSLLQSESLVDVTLSCEGKSMRAHKLVLSACSPYFKTLFQDHSEAHPIVILKDVKFSELKSIIQFMYRGEVEVDQNDLDSLFSTAEGLMIRGLTGSRPPAGGFPAINPPRRSSDISEESSRKRARPEDHVAAAGPGDSETPSGPAGGAPSAPVVPSTGANSAHTNFTTSNGSGSPATIKQETVEQDDYHDINETSMDAISQLCRPELREESVEIRQDPDSVALSALQDPLQQQQEQMQAALASVGIPPQAMAMNSSQREAMQQQMQMFQEYMMPMLGGLGLAGPHQVHSPAVNVISNAPPTPTAGMSGLSCNVCAMIMPDLPTLEQHLRIHEEEKPYKCVQCGQRYKYQSAYQRHIDMNHTARLPQEKPYKCEVCGQFFKYLKSFHKHRANHSAIDRILNDPSTGDDASGLQLTSETMMAALAGYQQRVIQQQVMSGHPEMYQQQPPEPLPSGGETERKASAPLEDKIRTGPAQASEMREDDKASITITAINPSPAASAGSSQIAEVTPPVQVKSPQQADQDSTNENDEAAGMTPDGASRSWICPYCLKGFRGKENLKLHIRTHTGEKPYECGMCPKRFVGKSDLNRHLRIHTGEKPYECNICMRRFARGDYLSKHMVTHGVEDGAGSGSLMTSDSVASPGEEEDDTTMANIDGGSPPSAGAEAEDAELEDLAMQKEGACVDATGESPALASVAEDVSK